MQLIIITAYFILERINNIINIIQNKLQTVHHYVSPIWFILFCENINTNKVNKCLQNAPCQVQTGVVKDAAVIEATRLATERLG